MERGASIINKAQTRAENKMTKEHEYRFILEDKEKLIRLFAFTQGWQETWLTSEQESMESLYDRKVDRIDCAVHCVNYKSYPVDDHSCLDHAFLEAFFAQFPKIEILDRPNLTFVSAPVPPRMVENYKYEDAWKHHAQVLVLKKPQERIEYLYSYVPEKLKKLLEEKQEKRRQRMNEISKTH